MRDRILAIFLLVLAAITIWAVVTELPQKEYANLGSTPTSSDHSVTAPADSPAVSAGVIRLHILADSDSETDQSIKLAIRDALLPYLNAATLDATTKEEALAQLHAQCSVFKEVADTALKNLGAEYTANISVETVYFPIRIYGSQTYLSEDAVLFPPGYYDSVQVTLGKGEGHNWWCLAYPSLCFIDATYDYIPKESDLYKIKVGAVEKSTLAKLFYGEQGEQLLTELSDTASEDTTVTINFGSKLLELLRSLFSSGL